MSLDKKIHQKIIDEVLQQFNATSKQLFVLKGGTALQKCYNLDRLSEDIDLDAPGLTAKRDYFFQVIADYCSKKGYTFSVGKDTETVGRARIHYGKEASLKVEVSYRRKEILPEMYGLINGLAVYSIDQLSNMKCSAYLSRSKIRDLYDICFIANNYYQELNQASKEILLSAFEYKGLEEFDYLIAQEEDMLIDKNRLETMFLEAFSKVGLLEPKQVAPVPEGMTEIKPGEAVPQQPSQAPVTPAQNNEAAKRSAEGQARRQQSSLFNREKSVSP